MVCDEYLCVCVCLHVCVCMGVYMCACVLSLFKMPMTFSTQSLTEIGHRMELAWKPELSYE